MYKSTDLPALRSFAEGLLIDHDAVAASLALPYSNGPTEGVINIEDQTPQTTILRTRQPRPAPKTVERAGQGCVLASPAFERIAHPSVDTEGRRTPALRFGDPRVMALTGAQCSTLLAATRLHQQEPSRLMTGLLGGTNYTPGQMTYDLRRLRLNGLIRRLPRSNRYVLTDDGVRIAVFYTKVYNRLLIPLTAANQPQAPPDPQAALKTITAHVDDYAAHARLPLAS